MKRTYYNGHKQRGFAVRTGIFRGTRCDQYPPTLSVVSEVVERSGVLELLHVFPTETERLDGDPGFPVPARPFFNLSKKPMSHSFLGLSGATSPECSSGSRSPKKAGTCLSVLSSWCSEYSGMDKWKE